MASGQKDHRYATRWKPTVPQPSGFIVQARRALRHGTLSILGNFKPLKPGNFLRCLYAHYVFDDQKLQFEKIIRMLKGMGSFIDTDSCIKMIEGQEPIEGRFFHLSFDDGFRNVFQNAIPILKEFEVPAIMFVPTSLIGADYETMKPICLQSFRGVLEMLDWEDLRTLLSWGYEIGSHTRTHVKLSEITRRETLESEICGSRLDLETRLGSKCQYISWPFGTRSDIDPASLEMIRQAEYRACFGAFRSAIIPGETPLFSIPRHHFEPQWPLSHIRYFAASN